MSDPNNTRHSQIQTKVQAQMKWDKEVKLLEEQFHNRGLQFTAPIEGLSLMQAYGYLDGKRFYFHLHNGIASLCVGIYDRITELDKAYKRNLLLSQTPAGSAFESGAVQTLPALEIAQESDVKLFPSIVLYESRLELDHRRLTDLFAALIETLKPAKVS